MIRGEVQGDEAVVELTIVGSAGASVRLPFIVDTGFSGDVTLPSEIVEELELPRVASGRAILGDGSLTEYAIHRGMAEWNGVPRSVDVDIAEAPPLLGMELLKGHRLQIDVLPGGTVSLVELPR